LQLDGGRRDVNKIFPTLRNLTFTRRHEDIGLLESRILLLTLVVRPREIGRNYIKKCYCDGI